MGIVEPKQTIAGERPLTLGQLKFVDELMVDPSRNGTRAYMRAYPKCSAKAAGVTASRLLADERILAEIAQREAETRERNRLSVDLLIEHLRELVTADPRELIAHHRGACRHCWGVGFRYQRTQGELEREVDEYKKTNKREAALGLADRDELCAFFDYKGGVGFNPYKEPNKDCPECFGKGHGYTYVKDTRTVSPAAARLFAGVKETKNGIEVITRSQDKALELAMRAAGMLSEKKPDDENEPPPPMTVNYVMQDASDPANAQHQAPAAEPPVSAAAQAAYNLMAPGSGGGQ